MRIVLILLLLTSLHTFAFSQYNISNLSISENADAWFQNQIGVRNTELVKGIYYQLDIRSRNSHPFFQDRNWILGDIMYAGHLFQDVNLYYQIEKDVLLTKDPSEIDKHNQPILINYSKIDWFNLNGHLFKKYRTRLNNGKESFYDVIYEGDNISLLAKRKSTEEIVDSKIVYVNDDIYVMRVGSSDIVVRNSSKWIRNLKSHKDELRTYLKLNEVRKFEDADYQSLKNLASYSDELLTNSK